MLQILLILPSTSRHSRPHQTLKTPQLKCQLLSTLCSEPPIYSTPTTSCFLPLPTACNYSIQLFIHLFTVCLPQPQCKLHRPVCLLITESSGSRPGSSKNKYSMSKLQELWEGTFPALSVKQKLSSLFNKEEGCLSSSEMTFFKAL